ncbi:chromo domain-containing protein 2 [Elsinoe australis]|uniref:Chromo domain-containing protein 2 n=1 Tax=Elsinoe australis TaxID=40998 RepID=A0A4V6DUF1_9PEZI|nr:chromo domain-containing protein 2 [Elsinoe australis]
MLRSPTPVKINPLSSRLSDKAPRSAHIISRQYVGAGAVPAYTLRVGNTTIPDVELDEIFEFLSPQDLETFENASFKRENDEKDIIQQALHQAAAKRGPGRPRKDQTSSGVTQSSNSNDDSAASSTDAAVAPEIAAGRNGRPRPSYSHLYKRGRGRARRSRGGYGPTRAEWQARQQSESEQDLPISTAALSINDTAKRRRLDTSRSHSRSRRTSVTTRSSSDILSSPQHANSDSQVKRETPSAPPEPLFHISTLKAGSSAVSRSNEEELLSDRTSSVVSSSTLESSASLDASATSVAGTARRPSPTSLLAPQAHGSRATPTLAIPRAPQPAARSSSPLMAPPKAPIRSSPSINVASASDDDDEEGESYAIEKILDHHLSDPKTHPAELGRKPVMLYQVKWEGYDELTWEPVESFDDKAIVEEYWQRAREESQSSRGSGGTRWKGKGRA